MCFRSFLKGSAVIVELLQPAKIVFGLRRLLSGHQTLSDNPRYPACRNSSRNKKIPQDEERFSYIGDGVAVRTCASRISRHRS